MFRMGITLLFALLCCGDGHRSVVDQREVGLSVFSFLAGSPASERQKIEQSLYITIWLDTTSSRVWLREPAESRLELSLDRVMEKASAIGVRLDRPVLLQTPRWTDYLHAIVIIFGKTDEDGRTVTLSAYQADHMTDADLDILVAHELGHCYDMQTGRRPNPHFSRDAQIMESEPYADELPIAIYGKGRVEEHKRHLSAD